ncbi:MAG: glycosyltransferase family 2 protein [Alloprevotella sp.]|nr:glycosyltransferase family 2 protein [Alloprevotella sp.]
MTPVLSVIVPVYNVAPYLARCVESLLGQNFHEMEIILIDDGSTDASGKMCDLVAAKDCRVRVIHKSNGGQSSARNAGLDVAVGRFITFVDADDSVSLDAFAPSVALLEENGEVDIVQFPLRRNYGTFSGTLLFERDEVFGRGEPVFHGWLVEKAISNYVCAKVFRRELCAALRFREGMVFEDRHAMASLLSRCRSLCCIRSGCYYYCEGMVFEDRHAMASLLSRCRSLCCIRSGCYYYFCRPGSTTQKPETPYSLESKLVADLNIVAHAKSFRGLRSVTLERYYNAVWYAHRLYECGSSPSEYAISQLRDLRPAIADVVLAKIPIGIKSHLLRHRITGHW